MRKSGLALSLSLSLLAYFTWKSMSSDTKYANSFLPVIDYIYVERHDFACSNWKITKKGVLLPIQDILISITLFWQSSSNYYTVQYMRCIYTVLVFERRHYTRILYTSCTGFCYNNKVKYEYWIYYSLSC